MNSVFILCGVLWVCREKPLVICVLFPAADTCRSSHMSLAILDLEGRPFKWCGNLVVVFSLTVGSHSVALCENL